MILLYSIFFYDICLWFISVLVIPWFLLIHAESSRIFKFDFNSIMNTTRGHSITIYIYTYVYMYIMNIHIYRKRDTHDILRASTTTTWDIVISCIALYWLQDTATTRRRVHSPNPFGSRQKPFSASNPAVPKDHSNIAVHSRLVGHSSSSLSHAVQSHRSTVVTCSHCVSICVDAISTLERTLWISMTSFTLDYTQTPRVISEAQELSPQSFSTCWKISWWLRLLTSSLFANSFLRSSCSLMCSSCTGFSGWLCFRCFFFQICSFHRFYHLTPANSVFTSKACTWVDKVAG